MQLWLKYSILIAVIYTLWTILWEFLIKKSKSKCYCNSLKVYVIAGIIAFVFLIYHIKTKCKHHENITDIFKESKSIYTLFFFISLCILISNYLWVKALKLYINAGYITTITNLSVIIITLFSAYKYSYKIKLKHIIGIFVTLYGAHLVVT